MTAALGVTLCVMLVLVSCSETERKGIDRLAEVGYDVADGQRGYYDASHLDTDGDGVPDDVDRYPMDRDSIYFPQDNPGEDISHE